MTVRPGRSYRVSSDAVIAGGRLAFLAGQGPIQNGTTVGGSIAEQTRMTLQNLAGILEQLGADASACGAWSFGYMPSA
jgi:enamine deaminase RidA (YjgF/YER057c/UK114 family)